MVLTAAVRFARADSDGIVRPESAATVMDPYVVTSPKTPSGLGERLSRVLNAAVGKKFLNLRGGPLLDAIFYRTEYLRDHPGERAVVVVTSEPKHGRVTSATVAFSRDGRLYASSAALGNDTSLAPLTPAALDHPETIERELGSRRESFSRPTRIGRVGEDLVQVPLPPRRRR